MRRTLFLCCLVLLAMMSACAGRQEVTQLPRALAGRIDLSRHDFAQNPVLSLGGQWKIVRQQLLAPAAFAGAVMDSGSVELPGDWKQVPAGVAGGEALNVATLGLVIVPPSTAPSLALQIRSSGSAYTLWLNGQLAAENGVLSSSGKDEKHNPGLVRVPLPATDGKPVELVMQISNHDSRTGFILSVDLGQAKALERQQHQTWGLALAVVGTLILLGLYHVALFAFRPEEKRPLYLGLYSLLWAVYVLCAPNSSWVIRAFLPDLSGEFILRAYPFCYFVATPLSYQFYLALYPQEFPDKLKWLFWIVGIVFGGVAVLGSGAATTAAFGLFHFVMLVKLIVSLVALPLAAYRKREGAMIILIGYAGVGLAGVNDMLYDMGVQKVVLLLHVGMLFLTVSQALALALRFSRLFKAVEDLGSELVVKNRNLEAEIAERERLQQEVVTVSEDERRRISHELHDGLCQQLTGARLRASGLATAFPMHAEQAQHLKDLSVLLEQSVEHAYELSHGLWPVELETDDIASALRLLAHRHAEASGVPVSFSVRGDSGRVPAGHAVQLHAIAREALANALKHAAPDSICIELDCARDDAVSMSVIDDGRGRQAGKKTPGGLGVRIMSYRARMMGGALHIDDGVCGGTQVSCVLPYPATGVAAAAA